MEKSKKVEPILALGKSVFIRTVTHYYTGRVVRLTPDVIQIEDAAWIADSARWNEALTKGAMNEIEPFPAGVEVRMAAVVDVSPWLHALPREVR